ncbi:MAG: TROVE domain-containing protein [Gemmatimonadales bacterium]
MDFTQYFATRMMRLLTPQAEPIPGSNQVANSGGGYSWPVDPWTRLDRFLVLGSEGGTYYIGGRELTRENARAVVECVAADGPRVVRRIVEISGSGRAPKNDPALFFALAIAAGLGDAATKTAVWTALPEVVRTGTHLFHWLQYVQAFRGWGRGVRRAVAAWYTAKPAEDVIHQVLKYPSRDGWAHRDALRLAHPKAPTVAHDLVFRYATRGWGGVLELDGVSDLPVVQSIEAVQAVKHQMPGLAAQTIARHRLTREMVPTELLVHAVVWEALLERMPLTAMIRNLGVMSKVGLLVPMSDAVRLVVERLGDRAALRATRVHPITVLAALKTYAQGRGMKGPGQWSPVPQVVNALDAAFYLAFENAPSTGKRVMLALDVSGSMGSPVHGMNYLSCREASAAMALVTAAREPRHMFTAFTEGSSASRWYQLGSGISQLAISPRQRLDDVVKQISRLRFGGTDCALPMLEATKHRWPVDLFVIYTDSETWAGQVHPAQALRQYRERMGIPAKLAVVGMASNGFTIADPDDAGMLDVVGFDPATPSVIADFAAPT